MPFDLLPVLWALFLLSLPMHKRIPWRLSRIAGILSAFTLLVLCVHGLLALGNRNGFSYFELRQGQMRELSPIPEAMIPEQRLVLAGAVAFDDMMALEKMPGGRARLLWHEYKRMEEVTGSYFPSPILSGLLFRQSAASFRVTKFSSMETANRPAIFLHGGAGSFVMECWLVASILRREGYTTYCPTYDFVGWWPKPEGEAIFAELLRYVQREHPGQKVLLAGLSNGGHGALAFTVPYGASLKGTILLSGGDPHYRQGKVPALVIWGRQDERIPFALGKKIVERHLELNRMVALEGDHFVLLRQHAKVAAEIHEWLKSLP